MKIGKPRIYKNHECGEVAILRQKFGVPHKHKLEEIEGWWSTVKADVRIWIRYDEDGIEVCRYKMEEFPGDIPMWSVVDGSWQ